jgi:hypothetical protein
MPSSSSRRWLTSLLLGISESASKNADAAKHRAMMKMITGMSAIELEDAVE